MSLSICTYESPFGVIKLVVEKAELREITFADRAIKADVRESDLQVIDNTLNQLKEYFSGERIEFDLPIKLSGTEFQQSVLREVSKIEFGKTTTYGHLAQLLGDKNLVRAIGAANGNNKLLIVVPCHRVIGASGELVGYAGGIDRKRALLNFESDQYSGQKSLF